MARTEYVLGKKLELVLASLEPSNRLVCLVMLHTGLRVSDVLALKTEQIARSSRFWVKEKKTGKAKMVGLPAELRDELLRQAGEVWLFPGSRGQEKARTRQAVWADIKRAQRAFRIKRNLGSHSMRKAYANELMGKYGNVEKVRRALNHSSQSITALYIMADELAERKGNYTNRVLPT
jgi:integrase